MKKMIFVFALMLVFNAAAFAGNNKATAKIVEVNTISPTQVRNTVEYMYQHNVANTFDMIVDLASSCTDQNNAIQAEVRLRINQDTAVGGSEQSPANVITDNNDVRLYGACQK